MTNFEVLFIHFAVYTFPKDMQQAFFCFRAKSAHLNFRFHQLFAFGSCLIQIINISVAFSDKKKDCDFTATSVCKKDVD